MFWFHLKWYGKEAGQVGITQTEWASNDLSSWNLLFFTVTAWKRTIFALYCCVRKNRFFSLIASVLHCGWLKTKCRNTVQERIFTMKRANWWSSVGVIHYSFMRPSKPVTVDASVNWMKWWVNLHLINRDKPVFLQHNAQPDVAQETLLRLQDLNLEVLCHTLYSPNLTPTFMFSRH